MTLRKVISVAWLALLLVVAGVLLWYNQYRYSLPTPVPANYRPIANGKFIPLEASFVQGNGKPTFIHFFNPDCPCSRFNIDHFKLLVAQYGHQVNFGVVVLSKYPYNISDFKKKYHIDVPVSTDGRIAVQCGVYSTPQAVILTRDQKLYYRGNYNRSRYCADEQTAYAKQALASYLSGDLPIHFNRFALTAYGCQAPGCYK